MAKKKDTFVLSANRPFEDGEFRLVNGNGGPCWWRPGEEEGTYFVKAGFESAEAKLMTKEGFNRIILAA